MNGRALRPGRPGRIALAALVLAAGAPQPGLCEGAVPGAPAVAFDVPTVPEPEGYRMEDYDAPVPETLAGATVVAAEAVRALRDERDGIVVDVIPAHRPPPSLPAGQAWLPPAHRGIPGALWLPDTGFGALAPITERYLFEHLERASGGDRGHPLVFYCRIDCWMSWNAAKRALAAGYSSVYWYRDGIEDWRFEGFPTVSLDIAPGERLPPGSPADNPDSPDDVEVIR